MPNGSKKKNEKKKRLMEMLCLHRHGPSDVELIAFRCIFRYGLAFTLSFWLYLLKLMNGQKNRSIAVFKKYFSGP